MSSKKTKSTKESKKSPRKVSDQVKLVPPDCWIKELAEININDDHWKCSVTIIEEESTDSTVYIEHFNESTITGNRLSVKGIFKGDVINTVVKNMIESNPNKKITPLSLLCSEIFKLVGPEFVKEIPTSLLSSIIKYIILEYKEFNIKVREGMAKRKKEFEEYQQSLWGSEISKPFSSKGANSSKGEGKSKTSAKGTKEKGSGKAYTKLIRRGEEWKDKTWIDDSPPDGPELYIGISGFLDAKLPLELLRLNVPLQAITKLSLTEITSNDKSKVTSVPSDLESIFQSLQEFKRKSSPYLRSNCGSRADYSIDKINLKKAKISRFWKDITIFKSEIPTASMFKNVMFLQFIPQHSNFSYEINIFQEEIYKQISYFLYDVFETTKQHSHYLSELKLTSVFEKQTHDLSNMHLYKLLLDSVPQEILNIPFILDAILIQTCELENKADKTDLNDDSNTNNFNDRTETTEVFKMLLSNLNKQFDLFSDETDKSTFSAKHPHDEVEHCNLKHIIKHFDNVNMKTFHLDKTVGKFVRERTMHILKYAWNNTLINLFSGSFIEDSTVKLCNEIVMTAEESEQGALNYYIYLIIINNILNSLVYLENFDSVLKINSLKEGNLIYEKEDLCKDCIFEVESELFSVQSLLRNTVLSLNHIECEISAYSLSSEIMGNDLFYIEDMTTDILIQWIQAHFYSFKKIESRHCTLTDQIVIILHNFVQSKNGIFEENWIGKLTTLVPIRDFVDFILKEEEEWLSQIQTQSFNENLESEKSSDFSKAKQLHDLSLLFPEHFFISHRSLKYEKMIKERTFFQKSKQTAPKTTETSTKKTTKPKIANKSKEDQYPIKTEELVDSSIVEKPKQGYRFFGYDLGDPVRVQFNGFTKEKILDHCCRLTLQSTKKLLGENFHNLSVSISGHILNYSYKPYCETSLNNPFHLILSSGIVLYFGLLTDEDRKGPDSSFGFLKNYNLKQTASQPNSFISETEYLRNRTINSRRCSEANVLHVGSSDVFYNEYRNSSDLPHNIQEAPYCKIPLVYDLKVSLPNGLYIEMTKDNTLFYVRQQFLSKSTSTKNVEKEKLRCYLSNGCIVKFMLNDKEEVLSANGTVYTILEHKARKEEAHTPEGSKTTLSDTDARQSKKVSMKDNGEELSKPLTAKGKIKRERKSVDSSRATSSKQISINIEKVQDQNIEQNIYLNSTFIYKCTNLEGKRFLAEENIIKESFQDLLTSYTVDVAENCIRSERTDGVSTKLLSDGSLMVMFPDGSCITSTPVEMGEVFCDWSSEELKQWFLQSPIINDANTELNTVESLSKTSAVDYEGENMVKSLKNSLALEESEEKNPHLSDNSLKTVLNSISFKESIPNLGSHNLSQTSLDKTNHKTLLHYHEDGFIVYSISYLMEHPNYSSVYFNANTSEVELKLPSKTNLILKNDGCYEAFFDQASLTVDNDEIYFNKTDDNNNITRTTIINNSTPSKQIPVDFSNYFNHLDSVSIPKSVDEFCQHIGIKSLFRGMIMKTDMKSGLLLYCIDSSANEIIIDYDLNIYELLVTKDRYCTAGSKFTALVINKDLSGFRIVSEEEVKAHLKFIADEHGLLKKNNNTWKSLLTIEPVTTNESNKWLLLPHYEGNTTEILKTKIKVSTYGNRESWIQPFVEHDEKKNDLTENEAVKIRLLHKIPNEEYILEKLKLAIEKFKTDRKSGIVLRIILNEAKVDFDLDTLIRTPERLCSIIREENTRNEKENDQFRRAMKHSFLYSLIKIAIIKARMARKKKKEGELKSALLKKEIPPYQLSCFGFIHNILDEMFDTATADEKVYLTSSSYEKVNFIINELLSFASDTLPEKVVEVKDSAISENYGGVNSIISEIIRNLSDRIQENENRININLIMDKPLSLITSLEVEFICKMFGSGDCPILDNEEFILEDILNARIQLSHYFENLRAMLEFHRGYFTDSYTIINELYS